MIKPIITALAVTVLAVFSAEAKTFQLPDADGPVASITFPDDWDMEELDGGQGGNSPDEHVYLAAVAVENESDMNAQIDDAFKMLKKHNVTLDEKTKKEEKFKVNGLDAHEMLFQGKDEDGACGVSIVFIPVKNNLVILTYWVTTAEEAKHQATVGKIVNSLTPAK